MNRFFDHRLVFCLGGISLLASACSRAPDPASETPVDLEPGMYEITISGAGLPSSVNTDRPHSACVRESDRASFPHKLVQNYYSLHPACTTDRLPREGNKIAGEISCAADPKLAAGANRFVYSGAVKGDNVVVSVQMKLEAVIKEGSMTEAEAKQLKLGMKMMERLRFVIKAKRTGAC